MLGRCLARQVHLLCQVHTHYVCVMTGAPAGPKISSKDELMAAGLQTGVIAQRATEAYLIQILKHGFFHADPREWEWSGQGPSQAQPIAHPSPIKMKWLSVCVFACV